MEGAAADLREREASARGAADLRERPPLRGLDERRVARVFPNASVSWRFIHLSTRLERLDR